MCTGCCRGELVSVDVGVVGVVDIGGVSLVHVGFSDGVFGLHVGFGNGVFGLHEGFVDGVFWASAIHEFHVSSSVIWLSMYSISSIKHLVVCGVCLIVVVHDWYSLRRLIFP